MALKTKAQLSAELASSYANNTTGNITPANLRTQQQNIIDSTLGLNEAVAQTVAGPVDFEGGASSWGKRLGIVYDALVTMISNATTTVIDTATTPVKVAGTFVVKAQSNFTCTTTGKCTYDGVESIRIPVHGMVDIAPVSGSNIKLAVGIALNGTVIAESVSRVVASSGGTHELQTFYQVDLEPGDYLELFVANMDSGVDVLVTDARLMIN